MDAFFAASIWPLLVEWFDRYARLGCTLAVVHGPDESLVVHGPFWRPTRLQRVRGAARRVLSACEGVRSERSISVPELAPTAIPAAVHAQLLGALSRELEPEILERDNSLEDAIAALDQAALVVREGRRLLALPVDRTAYVQTPASQRRLALLRLRGLLDAEEQT